jgi:hypothetical protein
MYQQLMKRRSDRPENCQVQKVASLFAQALKAKRTSKDFERRKDEGDRRCVCGERHPI